MLHRLIVLEISAQNIGDALPFRQLMVTTSPKLCLKMRQQYDGVKQSFRMLKKGQDGDDDDHMQIRGQDLLDVGDQARVLGAELPDKFSSLADHHFPLFLTMNQLLEMLDGVLPNPVVPRHRGMLKIGDREFDKSFWPHFDQQLCGRFKPLLVYGEMVTYVKGSLAAVNSPGRRLSREDYVAMAESRDSSLDKEERHNI